MFVVRVSVCGAVSVFAVVRDASAGGVMVCTVCRKPEIIAVAPGQEGEKFVDLFTVIREVPAMAWCERCWPWRVEKVG